MVNSSEATLAWFAAEKLARSFTHQAPDAPKPATVCAGAVIRAVEEAAGAVLKPFLPAQMDAAELEAELRRIIAELKPSGPAGFGMVMKEANQRLSGRAAGSEIAATAKRLLG